MMRRVCAVLLGSVLLAAPAAAQTVLLQDDFDGLVQGIPYTTAFANWNVLGNSVDVVANGNFGITCAGGSGLCLDLDGSPGPGGLESKVMYSFAAGDVLRFQFDISGNQRRPNSPDDFLAYLYFSSPELSISSLEFQSDGAAHAIPGQLTLPGAFGLTAENIDQLIGAAYPWTTWYVQFTLDQDADIGIGFTSTSADNAGPVIDNVLLTRTAATTVPEPSTYALMAAGLAAMAMVARRRRNA